MAPGCGQVTLPQSIQGSSPLPASHSRRTQDPCNWDIKGSVKNFIHRLGGQGPCLGFKAWMGNKRMSNVAVCALQVPGTKAGMMGERNKQTKKRTKKRFLAIHPAVSCPCWGGRCGEGRRCLLLRTLPSHPCRFASWGRGMGAACQCP